MKVLVTGSNGFVGKNLVVDLQNNETIDVLEYDRETPEKLLSKYTKECDFVFHLAGVNRPENDKEFMEGNYGFTTELLDLLKNNNNKAPIVISSSIQAALDNPYGKSKKAAEDYIFKYGTENDVKVYVYRLTNLFGKWSRPNYNSVVSTFCYNIANDLEITINNTDYELNLCYIDDVLEEFKNALNSNAMKNGDFYEVPVTHKVTLGSLADLILSFKESRNNRVIPDMGDEFTKKLYSTYLSYLPKDNFSYDLTMHRDHRGSFTEFIRTRSSGQVSVNVSKPNISKGDHWHHTKNEKFLVVSGQGIIKFRKIDSDEIIEYKVSDEKMEVVDIPPGYTHSIINTGENDLVTIMWVNECYDPNNPDTYVLEVE